MPSRWKAAPAVIAVALIVSIGMAAYGFSMRLPFFWDDLLHFRWLEERTLAQVWCAPQVFSHYRPLPFTIWKALRGLQGRYDAPLQHALPLGLHILNAVLILALVGRQQRQAGLLTALGAAVLFLLYPFSYQAVPWVGALTHPLVTALILGSLLLSLAGLERREQKAAGGRALEAASLGLALVAPFAHQTGVLIAPLLLLLLLTDGHQRPLREAIRRTWPYWLCTALGIAIWLVMPKEPMPLELLNLEGRWQTAVYFVQGLAYPVAPLARLLMGRATGLSDLWAIVAVCVPAVVAWSLLLWRAERTRLVALALGWFAVAAAPAWAMIKFSNVVDGPRLLYEASAGAALLWALPLSVPSSRRAVPGALRIVVVAAIAAGSYHFIQSRVPLYEQMQLATTQLVEARSGRGDVPLVCINYPSWFAPTASTFALGHEGVVLVPEYTRVSDILWLATGQEQTVTSLVLPDLLGHYRYYYTCVGVAETAESIQPKLRAGQVVVSSYAGDSVAVRDAGGLVAEGTAPATDYLGSFAGHIGLLQATSEQQKRSLRITLRWQCWKELDLDTTVFLHLYDQSGQLVAQADGYPLLGAGRLTSWKQGDEWRDVRCLPLPDKLRAGAYTAKVGLYPAGGGPRLAATDPAGQRLQDDAVPIATMVIR